MKTKDKPVTGEMVRKQIAFDIKGVSDEGEFEGYGSIFGNKDLGGDIIIKGAFSKSIATNPVSMLWQHDNKQPIGVYSEVKEDAKGLYVKGKLSLGVKQADEARILMKDGAIKGLSIGYYIKEFEWDAEQEAYILMEVELHEVSLVTFPMNTLAVVESVKTLLAGGGIPTKRQIESTLRDAGFSSSQAKAFIANGYDGLSHKDRDDSEDVHSGLIESLRKLTDIMKN